LSYSIRKDGRITFTSGQQTLLSDPIYEKIFKNDTKKCPILAHHAANADYDRIDARGMRSQPRVAKAEVKASKGEKKCCNWNRLKNE